MANSVDPDETAHYEQSHLNLHYLLYWPVGMEGLSTRYYSSSRHSEISAFNFPKK